MSRLSLRSRLIIGVVVVGVVLAIVSVAVAATTRNQLYAQTDQRLSDLSPKGPQKPHSDHDHDDQPAGLNDRISDAYVGVVTADGTLTDLSTPNIGDADDQYGPPRLKVSDLPTRGERFFTAPSDGGDITYRVRAQPFLDSVVITAVPLDAVLSTIHHLIAIEIIGSLGILAALALVCWWVLRFGIRPVMEITASATRIAGGDLAVRVPEQAPGTEVGDLSTALNQMLTTLDTALTEQAASETRLRRFVADASHELRTPITTIRGYAELYRLGGLATPAALDDAMRRTEQESQRMGRLVEEMLLLAKLDEHRALNNTAVDLAAVGRDAVADARATAPDRDVSYQGEATLVVNGDEDRLRQVVANVVANALVHTPPETPIVVAVTNDGPTATVTVADQGPGMPADVAARVTERFYRADPARSRHRGGSGLGMSIVESAMNAHGGEVTIDSAEGVGTKVHLRMPVA